MLVGDDAANFRITTTRPGGVVFLPRGKQVYLILIDVDCKPFRLNSDI